VAHRKQILCTKCRGTGAKDPNDVKTCPDCGGKGIKVETKKVGPGFIQQMQTTCNVCGGKGTTVTTKCPHCHGTKIEIGEEQLVMVIERGMPDQHKIRFEQEADEAPDTVPGDLYFTIVTLEHDRFSRKGNDLYLKEKITLLEVSSF
jgi:DnaJ-class molecular chaperone